MLHLCCLKMSGKVGEFDHDWRMATLLLRLGSFCYVLTIILQLMYYIMTYTLLFCSIFLSLRYSNVLRHIIIVILLQNFFLYYRVRFFFNTVSHM